jgi:hypothetical protein
MNSVVGVDNVSPPQHIVREHRPAWEGAGVRIWVQVQVQVQVQVCEVCEVCVMQSYCDTCQTMRSEDLICDIHLKRDVLIDLNLGHRRLSRCSYCIRTLLLQPLCCVSL